MEKKLKHLEFIQIIINRMANNSFLLKGWSVTLLTALFAVGIKELNYLYLVLGCVPVLIFWLLDGFFLWKERLFKDLYDEVRIKEDNQIDFSMDTKELCKGKSTWVRSIFSTTLLIFYLSLLVIILLITCFLNS